MEAMSWINEHIPEPTIQEAMKEIVNARNLRIEMFNAGRLHESEAEHNRRIRRFTAAIAYLYAHAGCLHEDMPNTNLPV